MWFNGLRANTANIFYMNICGFDRNVKMSKSQTYFKKIDDEEPNSNKNEHKNFKFIF